MSSTLPASRPSRLRRFAPVILLMGLPVWTAAGIALDIYGHRVDPDGIWDAIVVAGCRVLPSGRPSLSLLRRTVKAVELWKRGLAPVIVLTGGVGEHPPAEAIAAAQVARSLGVPDSALVVEDRSRSTLENARFAHERLAANRVIVVTDAYHVLRCEWFFRLYFQRVQGVGVVSPWLERARGATREALAIGYFIVSRPQRRAADAGGATGS